jgi:hypothetical protein
MAPGSSIAFAAKQNQIAVLGTRAKRQRCTKRCIAAERILILA